MTLHSYYLGSLNWSIFQPYDLITKCWISLKDSSQSQRLVHCGLIEGSQKGKKAQITAILKLPDRFFTRTKNYCIEEATFCMKASKEQSLYILDCLLVRNGVIFSYLTTTSFLLDHFQIEQLIILSKNHFKECQCKILLFTA